MPHWENMHEQSQRPLVSVVVTTKNESKRISACLESLRRQPYPLIEIIVVDNHSTDDTCVLARAYTDKVFTFGPERSAQRNHGMLEQAQGAYVMYLDADMTVSEGLIGEAVDAFEADAARVALYVPLRWEANNWINRLRGFEREFYDATVLDAVRIIRTDVFRRVGGFDVMLHAGEDWDMDRRVRQCGPVGCVRSIMVHHEDPGFRLRDLTAKIAYYAPSLDRYRARWGRADPDVRRQFGWRYRFFTVFAEHGKWRKLLAHPGLSFGMLTLKLLVAATYVQARLTAGRKPTASP